MLETIKKFTGNIYITGHVSPDFDSLASCMLVQNEVGGTIVLDEEDYNPETARSSFKYFSNNVEEFKYSKDVSFDDKAALIMVDICSDSDRLPRIVAENLEHFKVIYVIDHHFKNGETVKKLQEKARVLSYEINRNEKSCAEMIYGMMSKDSQLNELNHKLYTYGFLGDTNNKKFGEPKFELNNEVFNKLSKEWFVLTDKEGIMLAQIAIHLAQHGNYFVENNLYETIKKSVSFGKLACYLSYALDDIAWDLTVELEPGIYQHYLRAGRNSNIDVSQIARNNDGGGHMKAAGVRNNSGQPLIMK